MGAKHIESYEYGKDGTRKEHTMMNIEREDPIKWYHKAVFVVVVLGIFILVTEMRINSIWENAMQRFQLTDQGRPQTYIDNEFENQGNLVIDHATELMWQKAGSKEKVTYETAQKYVTQLNQERFAGYDDWRMPTLPELLSLLEPEKQSNGLYIHPIFDAKQNWCWSVDKRSSRSAWAVTFLYGNVTWYEIHPNKKGYVRAVRL